MACSLIACGSNTAAEEETAAAVSEETKEETTARTLEIEEVDKPDTYGSIELGEYKGLEATLDVAEVTDDDVQQELDNALASFYIDVIDRAVENGDVLNIDYEGKKDGVAFDGGTAQGASLTIGSGQFIEGFEDGLIGAEIGETRDLNLTFPEDYWNEELAGADVVFTVTVNGIQAPSEEINDDFAEAYTDGECKTVDALKTKLRKDLETYAEETAVESAKAELLTKVIEASSVNRDMQAVDYEYNQLLNTYAQYTAMYYGVSIEEYLTAYNMDADTFAAQIEKYAEDAVDQRLVVDAIFEKEGMEITAEDEQAFADLYDTTAEEMKASYGDEDLYTENVKIFKVLQFLYDNASIK